MRLLSSMIIGAALVVSFGSAAVAQSQGQAYGLPAIARADYNGAEARLIAQKLAEPDEPSVLLNLAYVYGKTGRTAEAAALYGKVLAGENVLMNTAGGQGAWSHDIATRAMDRTRQVASR